MQDLITTFMADAHWQWGALAAVLFICEMLFPVFYLLWPGLAAVVVAVVVYVFPDMGWTYQVILFAVLSVVMTVAGRAVWAPSRVETDKPTLNEKGAELAGRTLTLKGDLVDGRGRIELDDTTWAVRTHDGEPLKKGTKVTILSLDGATVVVRGD